MSSKWSVGARWRRLLPWAVGGLAFLGLALAYAPNTPAQAGKNPKASKDKKDKEAPEKKEAPRPEPTIPPIVDEIASNRGGVEQITYINEEITKGWKANKVQPAERCADETFLRRASLDIIGRIPTLPEFKKFIDDPPKTRRSRLIDRLVESEDCAQNLANIWTILLMTRTGSQEVYREQMHDWLMRQLMGKDTADWSKIATELITASGKTNENPAVNFVLTHMGEAIKDRKDENGAWDMVPVTSRTTRLFLGIRTQCVQCHDHPFSGEWGQHHFWGINAFFRQVDTTGRPNMMVAKKGKLPVAAQQFTIAENAALNAKGLVPYERRNAIVLYTPPRFLDGKKITDIPNESSKKLERREALATFITKDPSFAKAFVNRTWGHFFGKSFTKDAADDFGEHNPCSHPELLDKLASDWSKKYGHNPKVLIRWICNSQAYGLKTTANKYNDKPEDEVFFARMLLKPMSPEQLFESLMTATESKVAKNKEELRAKRKAWLDQLIVNFGNDEGEEGNFNGTVIQALMLMNGKEINDEIMAKEGSVEYAIFRHGANHALIITDLYRAALTRTPSKTELEHLLSNKVRILPRVNAGQQNTPEAWKGYYQDTLWALLNSNEFFLNH